MSMDLVERVTSGKSMHLKEANIRYNECMHLHSTVLKLLKRCNSVLMMIKCAFVVCINSFNTEPITDHVHLETFVNSGTKSFRVGRKVSETHRNIIAFWKQPTQLTTQQILNYPAFLM